MRRTETKNLDLTIRTSFTNPNKARLMIILASIHRLYYLKYVKEAYQILDHKNNKSIFVPLSLRLNIPDIEKLAKEYVKNEYFNIWIDFEGSATTHKAKIARVRHFLTEIEKKKRIEEIIVYTTNIKREIISNIVSSESPSSDILASIIGAV